MGISLISFACLEKKKEKKKSHALVGVASSIPHNPAKSSTSLQLLNLTCIICSLNAILYLPLFSSSFFLSSSQLYFIYIYIFIIT